MEIKVLKVKLRCTHIPKEARPMSPPCSDSCLGKRIPLIMAPKDTMTPNNQGKQGELPKFWKQLKALGMELFVRNLVIPISKYIETEVNYLWHPTSASKQPSWQRHVWHLLLPKASWYAMSHLLILNIAPSLTFQTKLIIVEYVGRPCFPVFLLERLSEEHEPQLLSKYT